MPTVLKINGIRFFFYSNEHLPKHIHIEKGERTAKFNLEPVELVKSSGFNAIELRELRNLIEEHLEFLIEKWNGFFRSY